MKIGALYIRVSTNMQEELSPDAQKRLLLEYAKKNNIYVPEEHIFIENGISGRSVKKRPEFQHMISLAKKKPKPFDIILVWKFSRFARNREDSIVYKSLLRKQCGIDVVSITENVGDDKMSILIEALLEAMDEYYSINLSEEVTRGMTEKALRGGYQARPPLGYKIAVKGEPPVIVPDEAKIVRIIFDKYVNEHMSFFDIARYLNTLGLKTSQNKNYEARSINYIIQNPTYCGMIRWNRTTNATNEIKEKSHWIITEGHHEAIISKELFDVAQKQFESSYHPTGARPSSTYKHWLSGLMKCPDCGRTMIMKRVTTIRNKPYIYFSCYGYCKGKCLVSHSISSFKIEPALLKSMEHILETKIVKFEYKEKKSSENFNELQLLEERLNDISIKEKRIREAFRNGIDTIEEYKDNKEILKNEENEVLSKIDEHKNSSINNCQESEQIMIDKIQNAYDIIKSDAYSSIQKNEVLKSIISKIVYNKNEDTLKVYYYLSI